MYRFISFFMFMTFPLYAMQASPMQTAPLQASPMPTLPSPTQSSVVEAPDTPTKKAATPKELAVALSIKVFDRQDEEVIAAFSQILTKDKKGNVALVELRYRAVALLEQERLLLCGEKR